MYSVTVYTNNGNGEYIEPISGTYAIIPSLTELMDVDNFIRLEITPSN